MAVESNSEDLGGISGTAIENWKMLYYRAGKHNEEEGKMAELLEKSESLKEYRTEDSFVGKSELVVVLQ